MSALRAGAVVDRLRQEDRGAVATVFAILLAGGVLLGMLALVVDVGVLYAEREELQTGADSAAMAVADRCALPGAAQCATTEVTQLARTYADANAKDGTSNVLEVCGTLVGPWPDCSAPIGNVTDCIPGTPTNAHPYVEVRTGTRMHNGSYLLPPVFAQTLAGNGGSSVRACARAVVGSPGRGLGVTFAECEFDNAVADVATLPVGLTYTTSHREVVLKLHDSQGPPPPGCTGAGGGSGFDTPGGFGWIDGVNAACEVTFTNGTYTADTGNSAPDACVARLHEATTNPPNVVYLPIYQSVTKQGKQYTVAKIAAFVPTGYFLGNGNGGGVPKAKASWRPGSTASCSGQERCIFGYFVNVTGSGELGPANLESLGATIVALSG